MTMSLIETALTICKTNGKILHILSTMANSYSIKLGKKNTMTRSTNYLVFARAMVLSVVIFDWIDSEDGAFQKYSPIMMKSIIKILKKKEFENLDLLQAIQSYSKNFNNAPG